MKFFETEVDSFCTRVKPPEYIIYIEVSPIKAGFRTFRYIIGSLEPTIASRLVKYKRKKKKLDIIERDLPESSEKRIVTDIRRLREEPIRNLAIFYMDGEIRVSGSDSFVDFFLKTRINYKIL